MSISNFFRAFHVGGKIKKWTDSTFARENGLTVFITSHVVNSDFAEYFPTFEYF